MAQWIKWNKGLTRRTEVLQIGRAVKKDRRLVAVACMEFWEWADDETVDGNLTGCTPEFVDDLVGIRGFAVAYAAAGWAEIHEDRIKLLNWERHNGESAKRRALDARSKEERRTTVRKVSASKADNGRTSVRSESGQSADQIREEKRREENNSSSINEDLSARPSGDPQPATAPPAAAAAGGDPLREWADTQARRPEWLPTGKPWISAASWLAMAHAAPKVTADQFAAIIREAKASRTTLKNPAGFVLSKIREAAGGAAC
ncbi:MAG: hypothetical protein EBR82_48420 [Caulobacteraceae bacterium]|nr:hypothetical protein [Caulobacteraceae bacterium]